MRNKGKERRGGITISKHTIVNITLSPIYNNNLLNAPHCIMKLCCNEWNRLNPTQYISLDTRLQN